jgi:hypothetical protein
MVRESGADRPDPAANTAGSEQVRRPVVGFCHERTPDRPEGRTPLNHWDVDTLEVISLTLGAAWASGVNLYAAVLVLGWLGASGQVTLPPDLTILSHPAVLTAAGTMYVVEFFADKTPGVDTGWDLLHTFIRIPAGALLAAGAAQGLDVGPTAEVLAALLGGGMATTSHLTKAGSRVLINTSPEPVSNWSASLIEDLAVVGGLWTALNHPWVFLILLGVFVLAAIWLLPRLWRALRQVAGAARRRLVQRRDPPTGRAGTEATAPPRLTGEAVRRLNSDLDRHA